MSSPSPQPSKGVTIKREWGDLNVLRGLAVVAMIIHHTWARFQVPLSELGELVVQHGSAAPVLFFLATGLGYGVGGPRSGPVRASAYKKVGLLLLADMFMTLQHGHPFGLNFLGFIGLSALVLEFVCRTRQPVRWATALAALVLVGRFVLGFERVLSALGPAPAWVWYALGARGVPSLAYPLLPWMFYPLIGYVLGDRVRTLPLSSLPELRPRNLLAVAVIFELLAYAAVQRGLAFFRWTVMSHAYFLFSVGVIGLAWFIARVLSGRERLSEVLAMRGISSLAVVPIHYGFIALAADWLPAPDDGYDIFLLTIGVSLVSFSLARRMDAWASRIALTPGANRWALPLLGSSLATAALLLVGAEGLLFHPLPLCLMVVGQLMVCLLLALPWPSPVKATSRG